MVLSWSLMWNNTSRFQALLWTRAWRWVPFLDTAWWRHQMETFAPLLAICAGESPTQRPVTWSFDVYFGLRPNKRLSKQSWGWWFETQSRPLWRHRNGSVTLQESRIITITRLFVQQAICMAELLTKSITQPCEFPRHFVVVPWQNWWIPHTCRDVLFDVQLAYHYSDSKWARWRLKSPTYRLFAQPFVQAQIKESIKAPCHWPFWGESTDDKGPVTRKIFPFADVIMWTIFYTSWLYVCIAAFDLRIPIIRHLMFSCDKAALGVVQSVCLSVCLSVRLSVRHTFVTMFPSSYHHEIFRSYYQWQMWRPCKRSEVKGQGHRGHNPTEPFPDCNSSLNSHMMMKWCI